jgi:HSP20 family protein
MEDIFDRFWGDDEGDGARGFLSPAMDMSESESALQVRLDLPGVDPKNIDIQINGNRITISGHREEKQEEKGDTFHRIERRVGRFSRSAMLPCTVDEDNIDASYHDGVLTISLPKTEEAKSKRIEVKST